MTDLLSSPAAPAPRPPATPPAPAPSPNGAPDEVSLIALLTVVLRHRRLLAVSMLATAAVTVALAATGPRRWTATAALVPQVRQNASAGFSGLAAQFGVSVPATDPAQSPQFYSEVLESWQILGAVADSSVTMGTGARRRVPVSELLGIAAASPDLRRELTVEALRRALDVTTTPRTSIVRISVRGPSAPAAAGLATLVVHELARFNLQTRQSQAAAERRFTEQRLAAARTDLRDAEARLRDFLQRNRIDVSPMLSFERERLEREVSLRQELYTTLSQAFERSRIEEVRDTPVFTVVEQPRASVRPDGRGLVRRAIVGLFAGAIVGAVLAFLVDFFRARRGASPGERAEFDALVRETVGRGEAARGAGHRTA